MMDVLNREGIFFFRILLIIWQNSETQLVNYEVQIHQNCQVWKAPH